MGRSRDLRFYHMRKKGLPFFFDPFWQYNLTGLTLRHFLPLLDFFIVTGEFYCHYAADTLLTLLDTVGPLVQLLRISPRFQYR
jgi:hypothetical protein